MKLVIGLGNPGAKYNFTRHNSGFLVLDYYFKVKGLKFEEKEKFGGIYKRVGDTIFIKPQNFYNDSGTVVQNFMHFYKVPTSDILVICDNFDLELGKIRERASGTAGGNNGLKSITAAISTDDYSRIRIGTGNDTLRRKLGDVDFVLSKFTPEEKGKLPEILNQAVTLIDKFIA